MSAMQRTPAYKTCLVTKQANDDVPVCMYVLRGRKTAALASLEQLSRKEVIDVSDHIHIDSERKRDRKV